MPIVELPTGDSSEQTPWNDFPSELVDRPRVSDGLAKSYEALRQVISPAPQTIYYPSCDFDVTPSVAFPDGHAIYADRNERAMQKLKEAGYDAHHGHVPSGRSHDVISSTDGPLFRPASPVDMVILLNPMIHHREVAKQLKDGGYIIANNYHCNADYLYRDPAFHLKAALEEHPERKLVSADLQKYFQYVETDEEFKRKSPEDFERARQKVRNILGTLTLGIIRTRNVLKKYIALIERYKNDPDQIDTCVFIGKKLWATPPLKQRADLFVFQKNPT